MSGLLVFGRTGQVAKELQHLAQVQALGRDAADLSDPAACAAAIYAHGPRAVINAAAYTAVDRAEEEEALATTINGAAPAAMAEACAALDIPLVQLSTDYVFAGIGTQAFAPDDTTEPQNAYGRSKLAGEQRIRAVGGSYAILRTSWVFSSHGSNFVKTMLRLSESRNELSVVDDQFGGPTPARAIAAACLEIANQLCAGRDKSGTYHFSGAPDISWCNFARAIFMEADRPIGVKGISTSDYSTPANRPLNSRLDCSSTTATFCIARPDWRAALADTLTELGIST
ncbi:dTDP-4-dehydrorhamnose reductase [Arsenicitalea aurantiaca]|uniref:dTDP-4-dehydrorhamnose reductase n=1 Tax=Arsenicitalea aurantiaca TaxID=1783274 RepID=A0A433X7C8_9HYPH|nr:dTDP-4-dehydrorhamnose reductase [Arsenicitalea aurantiaca]RUT29962.1 dTDP-4-dehydrorhamnose reductase [Arsenicitalea aurantiaca]